MPAGYDPNMRYGNSCDLLYRSDNYSIWNVPWTDGDGVTGDVAVLSRKMILVTNSFKRIK